MCRLLMILLLMPLCAATQSPPLRINQPAIRFDVPEALQKAGVKSARCIFKDSRGFMWFGTSNGLYRFDGVNTSHYRKQPGNTSLPDNTITTIAEDRSGNIWVATLKGIARMNAYNFHCDVYSHTNGLLAGDFDSKVYVDADDAVWAGNNNGISLFDKKAGKFVHVWKRTASDDPFLDYVSCITDYHKDTLAVGNFKGVFFIDKKNYSARFIRIDKQEAAESPVTTIFMDSRKRLWVGTWGNGFQLFHPGAGRFIKMPVPIAGGNVVQIVGGITETNIRKQPALWINGSGGLVRLSMEGSSPNSFSVYRYDAATENSLPHDASGAAYSDESGTVWLAGGQGKGIVKFSPDASYFNSLPIAIKGTLYEIQPLQIGARLFYCASAWYDETGFTILDSNWTVVRQFPRLPANSGDEATRNVSGISIDRYKRIWVSTLGGLVVMDAQFNIIRSWSNTDQGPDRLTRPKTNAVLVTNDTVWVACYKKGIDLYDLNYQKLAHFEANDHSGLEDDLVWKFYRDKKNTLWICGNNKLYRFNSNDKTFTAFGLVPGKTSEGCAPHDIAELPDGNLLIASENGLIHFNVQTTAFEYIRSPLLQREDNILSVTVDAEGNAWYLTTEHLVHYNLSTKRFTLFGADDGLKAEKGMQIVRSFKPGEVIIGQTSQILQFNYRQLDNPVPPPRIFITKVQVNDSSWQFGEPVRSMELRHFQNKLFVEFAGIHYTKADQNQYAYQLEGVDANWTVTNKNFASYANLGPGNYRLRVKAANYAGNWSEEYVIALSIAPPFWRTWWFLSLAVLVAGSILVLAVRYISQRNLRERILVLEKEQAVEKERSRIASDMHDDLGSGLTKIAILSEVAKKQLTDPENAVRQLENISSSSRELVDNLQDIIWVLNPRNDSLDSLAAYIREYALKFFEPFDANVQFQYPVSVPALKLSEEVRRNIFLVMKETFNNIAKHANGKCIEVELAVDGNHIELRVTDDGKGFEVARVPAFSNGLANMRTRMEQIGGQYVINSEPGKGTVTQLVIESLSQ